MLWQHSQRCKADQDTDCLYDRQAFPIRLGLFTASTCFIDTFFPRFQKWKNSIGWPHATRPSLLSRPCSQTCFAYRLNLKVGLPFASTPCLASPTFLLISSASVKSFLAISPFRLAH